MDRATRARVLWTLTGGGTLSCMLVWGLPAAAAVILAGLALSMTIQERKD
jgi:hypothetical protein